MIDLMEMVFVPDTEPNLPGLQRYIGKLATVTEPMRRSLQPVSPVTAFVVRGSVDEVELLAYILPLYGYKPV